MDSSQECKCPECGKLCGGAAGLSAHRRSHGVISVKRDDLSPVADWSHDEYKAVVQEAVLALSLDPFKDPVDAFRDAQIERLPPDRRPVMRQMSAEVRQDIKDLFIAATEAVLEIPVIVERPAPPRPVDWDKELDQLPLPKLLEIVGRKLGNVLEGFRNIQTINNYAAKPKEELSAPRAVRVAIFGFLPGQENEIRERYSGPFELRFMGKQDKDIPVTADWIIVTKHSGHSAWDRIRAQAGSDRVVFNDGGITGCLTLLKELEQRKPC